MPPRNVVPKPKQRPHPPLWVACSRRETIHFAARKGIGALSFSFVEPEDARRWVGEYYDLIASEECVPAGFALNPTVTVVLPMMCHEDEAEAIERGLDGAHFFGYSLAHYYGMGRHQPGRTSVWEEFLRNRDEKGFARDIVKPEDAPLAVRIMQHGIGSLRGAVGTPEQIRDLVRRYEAAGVDQVVFVLQAGPNRHEHICEALELFAARVLPEFAERAEERDREKLERLRPAMEAALARREPAREAPPGYVIDEPAELERAARARREAPGVRGRLEQLAGDVRQATRRGTQKALSRFVREASDERLERRFGRPLAQKLIFTAMARQFDPRLAFGFEGDITWELEHPGDSKPPERWTVRVEGDQATVMEGSQDEPAVRFRLAVPDWARLVADEADPQELMFDGRFHIEGDFQVASRVPEMFGGPPRF
jgi:hypothetical protein